MFVLGFSGDSSCRRRGFVHGTAERSEPHQGEVNEFPDHGPEVIGGLQGLSHQVRKKDGYCQRRALPLSLSVQEG